MVLSQPSPPLLAIPNIQGHKSGCHVAGPHTGGGTSGGRLSRRAHNGGERIGVEACSAHEGAVDV